MYFWLLKKRAYRINVGRRGSCLAEDKKLSWGQGLADQQSGPAAGITSSLSSVCSLKRPVQEDLWFRVAGINRGGFLIGFWGRFPPKLYLTLPVRCVAGFGSLQISSSVLPVMVFFLLCYFWRELCVRTAGLVWAASKSCILMRHI